MKEAPCIHCDDAECKEMLSQVLRENERLLQENKELQRSLGSKEYQRMNAAMFFNASCLFSFFCLPSFLNFDQIDFSAFFENVFQSTLTDWVWILLSALLVFACWFVFTWFMLLRTDEMFGESLIHRKSIFLIIALISSVIFYFCT